MIQFNLLPDIKIQYLKARRRKHAVMFASVVVIIASIAVLVLLASTLFVLQRKNINDLTGDIESASQELQNTPDLDRMLTVQNQLNVLTGLHDEKPVASRIFGYINQATPASANIGRLNVDFADNTITINGAADTLETVNTFVDTLKFTNYTTNGDEQQQRAFSDVVLSSFGRDSSSASYTINLNFDPVIFSELEDVSLVVPNIITTRPNAEQPEALFEGTEQ
jgi:Tfp pilus assembly protein PilN